MFSKITSRKLPEKKVVLAIGIPYTKELFDRCIQNRDTSDFIDALEFAYGTNLPDVLWIQYEPLATIIQKTLSYLKKKGVGLVLLTAEEDLNSLFEYETIIIMAHRHRFLDSLDFMGHSIAIDSLIESIPYNYGGTVDISSCYSSSFDSRCKLQAPFATFISVKSESAIDLRMRIYECTIRYMTSQKTSSYLESMAVVAARIIKTATENEKMRKNIFLGGPSPSHGVLSNGASVFAPSEARRGDSILVQVYIYENSYLGRIEGDANMVDDEASERCRIPLDFDLKNGDSVRVTLRVRDFYVESKAVVWRGVCSKVFWVVDIPEDLEKNKLFAEVQICVNDYVPIGELCFVTKLVDISQQFLPGIATPRQYRKVFISYSHVDEDKVKFIAEAYKAINVDYFFDRHYLTIGDIFPVEIQNYIEKADLFILCWSKNASQSDYVKKEIDDALRRAYPIKQYDENRLTIYPLMIEPRESLPNTLSEYYHYGEV